MANDRRKLALLALAAVALSGEQEPGDDPPQNQPPSGGYTIQTDGNRATLRAGNSQDPDGEIISYEWFWDGSLIASGETVEYDFPGPGSYNVRLRITDDDGATDEVTRTVTIEEPEPEPNQRPNAAFTYDIIERTGGVFIQASGTPSSDPDGSIVKYEWELSYYPDAQKLTDREGETVEFEIPASSQYYVALKVTDDGGRMDQTVEVVDARGAEPLPDEPNFNNTIKVCGKHPLSETVVQYEIEVGGEIRGRDDSLNANDEIRADGTIADGQVIGRCDLYEFHGGLSRFKWDGPIDVYVNGIEANPYNLPGADGPTPVNWKKRERNEGGQSVHVTVYTSKRLRDNNGRKSETTLVNFIEGLLKRTPWDYKIWFDLPIQHPPNERTVDRQDGAYPWWKGIVNGTSLPVVAKDSNILITNNDGGGLGGIGGNKCVFGMRDISNTISYRVNARDNTMAGSVYGGLHEFAHNLGSGHGISGNPTFGWAANDDSEKFWLRTPGIGGNPTTSMCGYEVPVRKHDTAMNLMYLSECGIQRAKIAPGDSTIR